MANNTYETLLVFSVANGEKAVETLIEKFAAIAQNHGTLESVVEWGSRKLAYPINDEPDGYYVFLYSESNTEYPAELERVSKITEGVLRSLVVKYEGAVPAAKRLEKAAPAEEVEAVEAEAETEAAADAEPVEAVAEAEAVEEAADAEPAEAAEAVSAEEDA